MKKVAADLKKKIADFAGFFYSNIKWYQEVNRCSESITI